MELITREFLSVEEARKLLSRDYERFQNVGGVVMFIVPPGVGKSRTGMRLSLDRSLEGLNTTMTAPTRAIRDEFKRDWAAYPIKALASREPATCNRLEDIDLFRRLGASAAHGFCRECPEREGCAFLSAQRGSARVELTTTSRYMLDSNLHRPGALVIWDEGLAAQANRTYTIPADLVPADLKGPMFDEVARLSQAANTRNRRPVVGFGLEFLDETQGPDAVLKPAPLPDYEEITREALDLWLQGREREARQMVESSPEHDALEALVWALEHNRAAVWLTKGEVMVSRPQPVPPPADGQTYFILDATADPQVYQAMWPDTPIRVVKYRPATKHSTTYHYPVEINSWKIKSGSRDAQLLTLARELAEGQLGVAPRARLQNWDLTGSQWLYHGGPQSRGSNEFKDRTRAVILAHHVPTAAVEVAAAALVHQNPNITAEAARAIVRRQLEGAPQAQAAHRIRPMLGGDKEVHFIGRHLPAGFHVGAQVVRVDVAAALWVRHGGRVTGHVGRLAFRAVVEDRGVWVPAAEPVDELSIRRLLAAHCPPAVRPDLRGGGEVSRPHTWSQTWAELAQSTEVHLCYLDGPSGKVAAVSTEPLDEPGRLEVARRLWPEHIGHLERLREVIREAVGAGERPTGTEVAARLGVSRPTLYKRLRHAGMSLDALVAEVGAEVGAKRESVNTTPEITITDCLVNLGEGFTHSDPRPDLDAPAPDLDSSLATDRPPAPDLEEPTRDPLPDFGRWAVRLLAGSSAATRADLDRWAARCLPEQGLEGPPRPCLVSLLCAAPTRRAALVEDVKLRRVTWAMLGLSPPMGGPPPPDLEM